MTLLGFSSASEALAEADESEGREEQDGRQAEIDEVHSKAPCGWEI